MLAKLENAIDLFGSACTGLLLALVVAQIVMRYGFGYTPFYTEEIGRYLLVWSALAGTAIAVRQRAHIRIEFLVAQLPERAQRVWFALLDLLCLAIFIVIFVGGIEMTNFARNQTSQGMQIKLAWPYAGIPIFFFLAAVFALANILPNKTAKAPAA